MVVVKEAARRMADPYRVSEQFYPALEAKVVELIETAKQRAEANGRKTLQANDL